MATAISGQIVDTAGKGVAYAQISVFDNAGINRDRLFKEPAATTPISAVFITDINGNYGPVYAASSTPVVRAIASGYSFLDGTASVVPFCTYDPFSGVGVPDRIEAEAGQINAAQFASLDAAVAAISSIVVSGLTDLQVTSQLPVLSAVTIPTTIRLNILPRGGLVKKNNATVGINGPFQAGPSYQVFFGFNPSDVTFGPGSVKEVYPEWWGGNNRAINNNSDIDSNVAWNSAIASMPSNCTFKAVGAYRLDNVVTLKSNAQYDLSEATIYPGPVTGNHYILYGNALSNFDIIGGHFKNSVYSTVFTQAQGAGTFAFAVNQYTGCSNFSITGGTYEQWYGSLNLYDCNTFIVSKTKHLNPNAAIAVVAVTVPIHHADIIDNIIKDGADDGILVSIAASNIVNYNVNITGNIIDKKLYISPQILSATAIRTMSSDYATSYGRNYIIANNIISDIPGSYANLFLGLKDSEIHDNNISRYGTAAVGISNSSNVLFSDNVILDSAYLLGAKCLEVDTSDHISVKHNKFTVTGTTGVAAVDFLGSANSCLVESNDIVNNTNNSYGAKFVGASNTLCNNKIINTANNVGTLAYVLGGSNNVGYDNKVSDDTLVGTATFPGNSANLVINNTQIRSYSNVFISRGSPGGVAGSTIYGPTAIVAGTSFTLTSTSAVETAQIYYRISN